MVGAIEEEGALVGGCPYKDGATLGTAEEDGSLVGCPEKDGDMLGNAEGASEGMLDGFSDTEGGHVRHP
jgi:hypothetical protein